MSSPAKIADKNVDPTDSVIDEATNSIPQENQHQQSLHALSAVPSTSQTTKPSVMSSSKPECLGITHSSNIEAQLKLPASSVYALPSFVGYSVQQKLESVLLMVTHIDTQHCCCKLLDNYTVKLEMIHRNLLNLCPDSFKLKDHVPLHLRPLIEMQLNLFMETLDFSLLMLLLEHTKQNITFINEQFHTFIDELCLDDVTIDTRSASVETLEQIKTKMILIDLEHESSMKKVHEMENFINGIADIKTSFRGIINEMRATHDETLGECSLTPLKTAQDLQSFNDRLGTDKAFFDTAVAQMQSNIRSTDAEGRLHEAFDLMFDKSLAARFIWSDTSESDADMDED